MKRLSAIGRHAIPALLILCVSACSEDRATQTAAPQSQARPGDSTPPPGAGTGNDPQVPASPAAGESRAGLVYDAFIEVPATGDLMAVTVMEPSTLTGGQRYPLVLHSHGFSQSRSTSPECPSCASGLDEDLSLLVNNGYGVISIDERGHGESTGSIRLMDPDFEGKTLVGILDWAQSNLDWLAYGLSSDGTDAQNMVVGAVGGSYGGAFQLLLNAMDPLRRLDAIVPEIAFYSLLYALAPNDVLRAGWAIGVYAAGQSAGSGIDRGHYDPFVNQFFVDALSTNRVNDAARDFFSYHGHSYFCEGRSLASNGPGRVPELPPLQPPRVNAMFWQGMRDPIFGLDQAYWNAECLKRSGGDVRLLSYQAGHNLITPFLDAGGNLFQDPAHFIDDDCGELDVHVATLAFFEEHLKGVAGAADIVPRTCISLAPGDAVNLEVMPQGKSGVAMRKTTVAPTQLIAGLLEAPIAVDLGIRADAAGLVLAGLPQLQLKVQTTVPGIPGEPILFAGIGHQRASVPGVWDLVDNQLTPLRGTGDFDLPMVGVGERLQPGDRLGLLLYGGAVQYFATGSLNAAQPSLIPVSVQGHVYLPLPPQ